MSRTIELPEPVYDGLVAAARAGGITPADWIAAKLPRPTPSPPRVMTDEERRAAREQLRQDIASLGRSTGTGVGQNAAPPRAVTDEERRAAREQLWQHVVSLGSPTGTDARQTTSPGRQDLTDEERRSALSRLLSHAGSIDMGRPTGTDNEQIDADLAREYGDSHEGS